MKHLLIIASIAILTVNFTGCADIEPLVVNKTPNANEVKVVKEVTPEPTRTPLPRNVKKDADGNLIKSDGWPIQDIIPKDTWRRKATGKTKNGKTVIYSILEVTPEGRPVSEAASPIEPYYEWRIYGVSELSGRDGKVFCYEYAASLFVRNSNANGMATSTRYRLCDYDGDSKYEFNGDGSLLIPNWVRSFPGNPATIQSNANRQPDCGILCAK